MFIMSTIISRRIRYCTRHEFDMSLASVHPVFGREVSTLIDSAGTVVIKAKIYPTEDLLITEDCVVEFCTSSSSSTVVTVLSEIDSFLISPLCGTLFTINRNTHVIEVDSAAQLHRYELAVWFHFVRNLLRDVAYPPWRTPLPLRTSFPLSSAPLQPNAKVRLICGAGRVKGSRPYMEDVDILYENIAIAKRHDVSVLGVFDGHGGKDCAAFVSDELPVKLSALLKTGMPHSEALYKSFLAVDEEYLSQSNTAGSTGTVLLWSQDQCEGCVASVGDTRAVLSRNGAALDVTVDHKAQDPEAVARVASAGGYVQNDRVNGILAVGRAFGDSILKKPRAKQNLLAPDPDVVSYALYPDDEMLIIATDGLWDVMTSQGVVDAVKKLLSEAGVTLAGPNGVASSRSQSEIKAILNTVCAGICTSAWKNLGSKDNVTLTVALFEREVGAERGGAGPMPATNPSSSQEGSLKTIAAADFRPTQRSTNGNDIDDLLSEVSSALGGTENHKRPVSSTFQPNKIPSSSGGSSRTSITKALTTEKRAADPDDLMDFLLDDTNF